MVTVWGERYFQLKQIIESGASSREVILAVHDMLDSSNSYRYERVANSARAQIERMFGG